MSGANASPTGRSHLATLGRNVLLLLMVAGGLSLALLAQTPQQQPPKEDKPFEVKIDVQEVDLAVTVVDKSGLMIDGLKKENFQVFEDKVLQEISVFKHEDIPLSMGLVIDNSGSMRTRKERVHSAALTFVRESNPDDETFVVAFDDTAYLQQAFTGSIGDLVDTLDELDPRGGTALYDAIAGGVEHIKTGRMNKKAILIISDGDDKDSQWTYAKLLAYVRQSRNIAIYAVGLLDEDESTGLFGLGRSPQKKAREALKEIAEMTGGRAYFPKSLDEVETICRQIARELRNQYTIGYNPKNNAKDGTLRKVNVTVVNPPAKAGKLTLTYSQEYTAPGGSTP